MISHDLEFNMLCSLKVRSNCTIELCDFLLLPIRVIVTSYLSFTVHLLYKLEKEYPNGLSITVGPKARLPTPTLTTGQYFENKFFLPLGENPRQN